MELGLTGKVALITGGSRGFGRAIAQTLAAEGADVALLARTAPEVRAAAEEIARGTGRRVLPAVADVRDEAAVEAAVQRVVGELGRLDVVVNSAGGAPVYGPLDAPEGVWRDSLETKLLGTVRVSTAAVPHLRRAGGGAILHIVGAAGKDPFPLLTINSVINAGLLAYTKCLADAVARDHIRVVALSPGAAETGLLGSMAEGIAKATGAPVEAVLTQMRASPLGRLPAADEVAACVAFLVSPRAAMITGTSLEIDAGGKRGLA